MIPFNKISLTEVTDSEMASLYEKIKTPKKIGAVMKWDEHWTDSPSVFCKDGVYYMYFIAINKDCKISGYETHLARSHDLINWEYVGPIFKRNDKNHWDSKQIAAYAAFPDINFDGTSELHQVNGSYYISYLAGNSDGYEPDPLFMGLAKGKDPTDNECFTRFANPILNPNDEDAREYETKTLYKSFLFEDKEGITGYKYVNAYNGKAKDSRERIFLAVSNDAEHWERYGDRPVIDLVSADPGERINGDPQIIKIEDTYVMFFFRYRKGQKAFNTFAASRDLINWNVWQGEPLVKSEYEWENEHAHKTWFVRAGGKNYHYYCACNLKGERFIALAVSE